MSVLFNPRFTVGLLIIVLISYANWVSGAPNNRLRPVDAVIVHAGGEGERLDRALQIVEEGFSETLVLMRGTALEPEWPEGNALCAEGLEGVEVVCPLPDPDTTIGEARALDILADQRGWEEVIAVTSDYHLRRAMHLDRNCTELSVYAAGAESPLGVLDRFQRVVWEMGGMIQAAITC